MRRWAITYRQIVQGTSRAGQGCGLYAVGDVVAKSLQQCSAVPPNIFPRHGRADTACHQSVFDFRCSSECDAEPLQPELDRPLACLARSVEGGGVRTDTAKNDAMGEVGLLYMEGAAGAGDGRYREANVKLLQELAVFVRSRRGEDGDWFGYRSR